MSTTIEKKLRDAGIKWRLDVVPIDRLHANPWNPRRMDDRTRQATRESIATFGFIDPITVREHPELDGHYQVIDGEHRWGEAVQLELAEVPVLILDVDTPTAMKLTVVLNQAGEDDTVALGALLGELQKQLGEQFTTALAYDNATLEHLLQVGAQDWSGGYTGGTGGEDDDEGAEHWMELHAKVPASFMGVWSQVRDRALEGGAVREHDDPAVATGMLIEALAAEFLASYGGPVDPDGQPGA